MAGTRICYSAFQLLSLRPLKPKLAPCTFRSLCTLDIMNKQCVTKRTYRGGQHALNPKTKPKQTGVNFRNLIDISKAYTTQTNCIASKRSMKIGLLNARSLCNKASSVAEEVVSSHLDCCAYTETWIKEDDNVTKASMQTSGYEFDNYSRQSRATGGGTALQYKSGLSVKRDEAKEVESYEFTDWLITNKNDNYRMLVVYRPPYSPEHPISSGTFFQQFSDHLESLLVDDRKIIIVGDFNFHMDNETDRDAVCFRDLLFRWDLQQHVKFPTHISGHTLDLVITRNCDNTILHGLKQGDLISDHNMITFLINTEKPEIQRKVVSYRKIKDIDMNIFKQNVSHSLNISDIMDVTTAAEEYDKTMRVILDEAAPIITKTLTVRPQVPWFSDELRSLKRIKRHKEKEYKTHATDANLGAFRESRTTYQNAIQQAKEHHYNDMICEAGGDQKKLFRIVNSLTKGNYTMPLPEASDNTTLANEFAQFFCSKIDKIMDTLNKVQDVTPPALEHTPPVNKLSEFQEISVEDTTKIIKSFSNASCELDPVPTAVVKSAVDVLSEPITHIINRSLKSGTFPECWKSALVKPLLKKKGLEPCYSNYRPVSNLPFVGKVIEKVVIQQQMEHIHNHALFPVHQSAYQPGHSTETALVKVMSDILMAMDRQEVTILVLLDLSAAFDTLDHQVFSTILEADFGICGEILKWAQSYLSNRSQRVVINAEATSDAIHLRYGVPQGSCYGPVGFLIYASQLFKVIETHVPRAHMYADDTQLYLSFRPNNHQNQQEAITKLELCINDIRSWMLHNKLKINDSKTEVLIIGSRGMLPKVDIECVHVGDATVIPVKSVRNLGAWFDQNLSMSVHIDHQCKKAMIQLQAIRKIRKCLTTNATRSLLHAFVTSNIDYCNSLLLGVPAYQLDKLQRIQNMAIRVLHNLRKYDHISEFLKREHWLPVKKRVEYKIHLLVFKALNGSAPSYLSEMLSTESNDRYELRSNDDPTSLAGTKTQTTFGDRAFCVAGPRLWNTLPVSIRNIETVNVFKSRLKTYLFTN